MLAPHELKNKEFTKSLRGYSTVEVDEHIRFLLEKYTELYRQNDELEKKLRLTEAKLDAIKSEEESIRTTLVNAQKAGTRIISEANERADIVIRSAKNSCDRLIAEMRASVKVEKERLQKAKEEVSAFKTMLFEEYRSHIELIEKIAPDADLPSVTGEDPDALADEVNEKIRQDLAGRKPLISGTPDPFLPDEEPDEEPAGGKAADGEETPDAGPIPAEVVIPDRIDDNAAVPDEAIFTAIRDSDVMESEELTVSRSDAVPDDAPAGGLRDAARRLGEKAELNDDEEFLRMLSHLSADDEHAEDPRPDPDSWEMVYDGRKKK